MKPLSEAELFAAYRGVEPSATLPESADDLRRRLVSRLRREELEASGLPPRPTKLPTADATSDGRREDR